MSSVKNKRASSCKPRLRTFAVSLVGTMAFTCTADVEARTAEEAGALAEAECNSLSLPELLETATVGDLAATVTEVVERADQMDLA